MSWVLRISGLCLFPSDATGTGAVGVLGGRQAVAGAKKPGIGLDKVWGGRKIVPTEGGPRDARVAVALVWK